MGIQFHVLSYRYSDAPLGVVDADLLMAELASAGLSQQPHSVRGKPRPMVLVRFVEPVSDADKAIVSATVAVHNAGTTALLLARKAKLASIKQKTSAIIAAGAFEYPPESGKLFGMSEVSQLNITGAFNSRNDPSFVYPVVFYTRDDLDSVSLADAAAVEAFHAAAVAGIRAIREGGAALKAQVIAASTVAQVDGIVDDRA